MKILTCLLVSLLFVGLCPYQSKSSQQINISKVWSRPVRATTDSQGNFLSNGVVYLTIANSGIADTLISVETDVCKKVELHQSKMVDGMMTMQMLKNGLSVDKHRVVELKPGSYHIMLIGMQINLDPGDTFSLTLMFENSGLVTVISDVKSP